MGYTESGIRSKILRVGQYRMEEARFIIQAPKVFKKTKEQEKDESTRRIEELRDEMKTLEDDMATKLEKVQKESDEMLIKAEMEAERVVKEAEKSAFERVKKSLDEKDKVIQDQQGLAEGMLEEMKKNGEQIIKEAQTQAESIKSAAYKEGQDQGRSEGFESGKAEVVSMVQRLRSIIEATIQERERILVHSERQIMNLVLTMVKKIVKKLTQEEENVVIYNTKEALSIVRGAMKVYIHVNPMDYEYSLNHKDELIQMIEGMPEVKFFEDPSVDRGGVFIETDLGEVDAKISTQLEELENQIKFYIPVKVRAKGLDVKEEMKEEKEDQNQREKTDESVASIA
jgi:flagellar assembly protein FliH